MYSFPVAIILLVNHQAMLQADDVLNNDPDFTSTAKLSPRAYKLPPKLYLHAAAPMDQASLYRAAAKSAKN